MTDKNGNIRWSTQYHPFGALRSEFVWQAENNLRFPGQYHDRSTGLYYNMFRHYRPDLGRYLTPDRIGLAGGINLYGYAGQNPINYIDPWGLYGWREFEHDAAHFWIGVGDVASLGITKWIRSTDWYGGDHYTNTCSSAYKIGEWAGFVASSLAGMGGGVRISLGRAARYAKLGSKASGLEFSHWIPVRYLQELGLKRLLGRSVWNGNYVSAIRHAMSDPYRMLQGWNKAMKWSRAIQQWVRIPLPFKGLLMGTSYGAFGMWLNEDGDND